MNSKDWRQLEHLLSAASARPVNSLQAIAMRGGDINRAYRVTDGKLAYFVKVNQANLLPMFEAEQVGLNTIRRTNTIRAPRPIVCGVSGASAFIVMEYLDLQGSVDEPRFAQRLAAMHLHQNELFGFNCDNTIGSTAQSNRFTPDWIEFWQRQRLGFQLELASNNSAGAKLIDTGSKLNAGLGEFFKTYTPTASLLHGDLWSGNYAADVRGAPVIYDPACYYGDHEADLAMMELFGSPGARFFDCYRELFAIDVGYPVRRQLYNLYHVLNHLNLFGGSYALQAQDMIDSLISQLH